LRACARMCMRVACARNWRACVHVLVSVSLLTLYECTTGPKCNAMVFASKSECFKCRTPKPGGGGAFAYPRMHCIHNMTRVPQSLSFTASVAQSHHTCGKFRRT
jgi:hypothetical protein